MSTLTSHILVERVHLVHLTHRLAQGLVLMSLLHRVLHGKLDWAVLESDRWLNIERHVLEDGHAVVTEIVFLILEVSCET